MEHLKNKTINLRFSIICAIILLAALSRLIPHPANFAPIGGMALFGSAYYSKRYWAYIIPIISMWTSDLILNNFVYRDYFDHFVWFYSGSLFTYGSFVLIVLLGTFSLKKIHIPRLLGSVFAASLLFFIISNFGVWFSSGMYPHTLRGLEACYIAGLPFLQNTVSGNIFYTAIMFGTFEFCLRKVPLLQKSIVVNK